MCEALSLSASGLLVVEGLLLIARWASAGRVASVGRHLQPRLKASSAKAGGILRDEKGNARSIAAGISQPSED